MLHIALVIVLNRPLGSKVWFFVLTILSYVSLGSMLERLVLNKSSDCTSQHVNRSSGVRVMTFLFKLLCSAERITLKVLWKRVVNCERVPCESVVKVLWTPCATLNDYMRVYTYLRAYIRIYARIYVYTHVYRYIRAYVHIYARIYVYTHVYTYICAYVRIYARRYVYTWM